MPKLKVGPLSKLPAGAVGEVQTNDATYALCNVDGELYCLDGTCPHIGGPLGQGTLQGHLLVCPWHGWEFDCRTGALDGDQAERVFTYPVIIENGEILIDLP